MLSLFFATTLDPWTMIRVDDPNTPGAVSRSETGAVLLAPPAAGRWRYESIAETDAWHAEEALAATNATVWQDAGHTGEGVRIAVFDVGWYGISLDEDMADATTQDCWTSASCEPPMDTFHPRFANEEGSHGYACAEVIQDIVPDATLFLVRVNGFTTFENATSWATRNDIDLISMSMSFYNNSFYDGTGPYVPLVNALTASDTLLVTSAGNDARGHWSGPFRDSDLDGRMDFDGENGLWAYLREGKRNVYVSWNQYTTCGKTDLSLVLTHEDGAVAARANRVQERDGDECGPNERLTAEIIEEGWYKLEVHHERGSTAHLKVAVHTRNFDLRDPDPHGALADPGALPGVLAVGAVRASQYASADIEGFSSWGPNQAGLDKPDIAGPNGLSTNTYGGNGFYGTSASTPVVTALIAQVLSSDPELSVFDARDRVQNWALSDDDGFGRNDPRWGHGKARLPIHDDAPSVCGHRPLLMPLFFLPFSWFRRRI